VIVVVEGPSAAGKSTYAARMGGDALVAEGPVEEPPEGASPEERLAHWLRANARRWDEAVRVELEHDVVVCDTDPLKLHYDWSLARIGEVDPSEVRVAMAAYRSAIADGALGIADLVLCHLPDDATLARQREQDPVRARHRFDLHRRLAGPLREWYAALEATDPGRVVWGYPEVLPRVTRRRRHDEALFDEWMARLERSA
jgi:hypothetical protein